MTRKALRHHVYHLVDPNTRTVRYVGKSTHPAERRRAHIEESRAAQNTEKKRWIFDLVQAGQAPVLVIVADYADEATARLRESLECKHYLSTIYNLHDPKKGARDLRARPGPAPAVTSEIALSD